MAVAAYASLVSLINVLDNLHYRAPFHLPHMDMEQIAKLQEKVLSLVKFVERNSERESPEIEGLWRKLAVAASEAEDMIDFYVVNQFDIISSLRKKSFERYYEVYSPLDFRSQDKKADSNLLAFSQYMEKVISKMDDCIQKDVSSVIKEEGEDVDQAGKQAAASANPVSSSSTSSSRKNVVVGIGGHVVRIMEMLVGDKGARHILPVIGMGGIGKTTLAESVFNNQCVVEHFDIRAWFTISKEYSSEVSLNGVLYEGGTIGASGKSVVFDEKFYKNCFGRRCLVVLDDVWTTKCWDDLNRLFPKDDKCKIRVMLTTRLLDVASYAGTLKTYSLPFLDETSSWELFCRTTFDQIGCPYEELEEVGRDIVNSCRGLPLEICVIGRMLASNLKREHWGIVAEQVSAYANSENSEDCLGILSLSYNSLPIHLKPCFLFMRVLREDEFIGELDLINSWVVEGFIKPENGKTLEETATQYSKDLIDRNLILCRSVKGFGMNSNECGVHDLLRDLCLRESKKESFIQFPKAQWVWPLRVSDRETRVCPLCHNGRWGNEINTESALIFPSNSAAIRRFVCDACRGKYSHIARTKLVRTITACGEIVEVPTASRYLKIQEFDDLFFKYPSWMHLLWGLQILIIFRVLTPVSLPCVIWDMPQLRCVTVLSAGASLPDPLSTQVKVEPFVVLKNLHSLSRINDFECSNKVLSRVPNLKDLHFQCSTKTNQSSHSLCNIKQLQQLEALHVEYGSQNIAFPGSLKRLTLSSCQISWEDVSVIGSRTNLEALALLGRVKGGEWNPKEGQFQKLEQLRISATGLASW